MENTRTFWNGNFGNIDGWMSFMYDEMTASDRNKKDKICWKYYRWFNDGDFPRGLKGIYSMGYEVNLASKIQRERINNAVESCTKEMAKYFIKKYMNAENRANYYKTLK